MTEIAPTAAARDETHRAWFAAFLLGGIVVGAQASQLRGAAAVTVAVVLALVPFVGVLLLASLLQHHERRPAASRRWTVLWGALVATGASSYANSFLFSRPDWTAVVLLAPVIEEVAKAAGILLLLHWGRIRKPLDGIIYALLLGGAFSLVENVFYFHNAVTAEIAGDNGVLRDVFLMRGFASFLAHPFFLAFAGAAAGIWHKKPGRGPLMFLAGWGLGVVVHGTWNHLALAGVLEGATWRVAPVFAVAAIAAIVLAAREGTTRAHIASEPAASSGSTETRELAEGHWARTLPWYARRTSLTDGAKPTPSRTPANAGPDRTAGNLTAKEPT